MSAVAVRFAFSLTYDVKKQYRKFPVGDWLQWRIKYERIDGLFLRQKWHEIFGIDRNKRCIFLIELNNEFNLVVNTYKSTFIVSTLILNDWKRTTTESIFIRINSSETILPYFYSRQNSETLLRQEDINEIHDENRNKTDHLDLLKSPARNSFPIDLFNLYWKTVVVN